MFGHIVSPWIRASRAELQYICHKSSFSPCGCSCFSSSTRATANMFELSRVDVKHLSLTRALSMISALSLVYIMTHCHVIIPCKHLVHLMGFIYLIHLSFQITVKLCNALIILDLCNPETVSTSAE